MKFHRSASSMLLAVASMMICPALPYCEAKLGSPANHLLPSDDVNADPHAQTKRNLGLSSCHEYIGQFSYQTGTNGRVGTSCDKLHYQASRGRVSPSSIAKKCTQLLVGLDGTYGFDATVANACPVLCGKPCDGTISIDNTSQQDLLSSPDVPDDEIRFPEDDSDEDIDLEQIQGDEVEVVEEEEEEEKVPAVVQTPPIQQPQAEEVLEIEEAKPTPTIASFEPIEHGKGEWEDEFDMELIPIHTMLLPDGQVLSYGTSAKGRQGADLYYEVWNWNKGIHGSVHKLLKHKTKADIFCSSLNVDPSNGNIIIMGGDVREPDAGFGIETVLEYDVKTETVRKHPKGDMKYARWYGTSVNLPNGDIFVIGGRDDDKKGSPIPEVYSPNSGFRTLKGASVPAIAKEKTKNHWWYPHTFVNSKGHIIVIMPRKDKADVYRIGVDDNGSVERIGRKPFEAHVRSPSIMFRTDQVAFLDDKGGLWVADISDETSVSWDKRNSIGHGRTNGSMALLPDGRVAIIGGASSTDNGGSTLKKAERSIQIWDPETNKLTRGASEKNARLYHSSALIMPDGCLISAGGGAPGPVKNRNGQVYCPDYMYNTNQDKVSSRPKITNCPRNINSGDSFLLTVDDTTRVVKVTTTKSGASSHTRNSDTRWLDLKFDIISNTVLRVYAEDRNTMIGGLWLVNVLDVHGIPSTGSLMGVDIMVSI